MVKVLYIRFDHVLTTEQMLHFIDVQSTPIDFTMVTEIHQNMAKILPAILATFLTRKTYQKKAKQFYPLETLGLQKKPVKRETFFFDR